jgi:hypothetical protein
MHSHYYGLFGVAAQALVAGWTLLDRRLRWRGPLVGAGVVLAGWIPWLPIFMRQRQIVGAAWWLKAEPSWKFALKLLYRIVYEPPLAPGEPSGALVVALALAALAGLVALARRGGAAERYLLLAVVAPWTLGFAASLLGPTVIFVRYLLFAQPFLFVAAALLACRLPPRPRAVAVSLLVAHAAWVLAYQHLRLYTPERPDAPAAAEYLMHTHQIDEPVVLGGLEYFVLQYYARDLAGWAVYDPSGRLPTYLGEQVLRPDERVVGDATLRGLASPTVLLVDSDAEGQRIVPPAGWVLVDEQRFPVVWPDQSAIVVRRFRTATLRK